LAPEPQASPRPSRGRDHVPRVEIWTALDTIKRVLCKRNQQTHLAAISKMFCTRSAAAGFFGPPFIMIPLVKTHHQRIGRQAIVGYALPARDRYARFFPSGVQVLVFLVVTLFFIAVQKVTEAFDVASLPRCWLRSATASLSEFCSFRKHLSIS
jgi:hypothetical protein